MYNEEIAKRAKRAIGQRSWASSITPKVDNWIELERERQKDRIVKAFILIGCIALAGIICLVASCSRDPVWAAEEYSDTEVVNAIYVIEGGAKAQYVYGIRSVKYSMVAEARRICFNTVKNNRKRFANQSEYSNFLEFLQSRYCPTKGKLSKAEQRLNGNWLSNLRGQLKKARLK